jgi:uncharacterized protein
MRKKKDYLLWEIQSPESVEKSYLFGTIHLWNEAIQPIFESVLPFIEQCDIYAAESQLDEMQQISTEVFYLKNGQQLSDLFPAKKYEKLCRQLKKTLGLPKEHFELMTPFAINGMLSNAMMQSSMPSIDEQLWQLAKSLDKQLEGIESVAEQFDYYQRMSLEVQTKQLLDLVKNIKTYRKKLKLMLERYVAQDISLLYQSSKKGMGALRKMMIYERNILMTEKIIELSKQKSTFIAIGAGHLAGQKGVLRLLEKKGFKIKGKNIFSDLAGF